jgi:hypothetical protein
MTIDDPMEVRLREIKGNVDAALTNDLSAATVAVVLSLIPGVAPPFRVCSTDARELASNSAGLNSSPSSA